MSGHPFQVAAAYRLEGQRSIGTPWQLRKGSPFCGTSVLEPQLLGGPLKCQITIINLETYFGAELLRAFPPRKRRRQESFLTDSTWVLRDQRLWLRKRATRFRMRFRQPDLFAAFRALQRGGPLAPARVLSICLLCGDAATASQTVQSLRDTRQTLRRSLRSDKRRWIAEIARQAVYGPTRDVVAGLRPLLQPRRRAVQTQCSLPVVHLEDGTLAADSDQALDRWVRHFAGNEGGDRCDPATLVEAVRQSGARAHDEPFTLQVGDTPSRCHIERVMAGLATGKASGLDCVPSELLKYGSGVISHSIFPLLLKLILRQEEAVQFKGGCCDRPGRGRPLPNAPATVPS